MSKKTQKPPEKEHFKGVVGQERAKKELSFYLDSHLASSCPLPHTLLLGSKGDGKTHLARAFARAMPDIMNPEKPNKAFYKLNAGDIDSPTKLFEDVLAPLQDKYCTIFIDEAHELPRKIQTILLSVLEPNKHNRTSYTFSDIVYEFDFHKITFLFATTEEDRIFHALKDRLRKLTLEPYTAKELAEIITITVEDRLEFEGDMLHNLAGFVRRNARNAVMVAEDALKFGDKVFTQRHLDILKDKLNMFPHGVTHNEVRLLKILANGECTLNQLASRMAQTVKSVQKEIEPYLIAVELMEIDGTRRITAKGREFLKEIGEAPEKETENP